MVILQFNKLIRNKWVWGAFAILVSAAFMAPDEWFRSSEMDRDLASGANKLKNVEFDSALYEQCRLLVEEFLPRIQGGQRAGLRAAFPKTDAKSVWKAYAAAVSAREAGYNPPDSVVAERVKALFEAPGGGFSEVAYRDRVKQYFRMEPALFEEQLRLWTAIETAAQDFVAGSTFAPAMELDQAGRDFTDKFTVQIAEFREDKEKSKSIEADDAMLEKWYEAHKSELALPDRYRLNFVKFNPNSSNALAQVSATEEAILERYESNKEKGLYDIEPATTNDVKTYKPLDEVRGGIEIAIKSELALEKMRNEVRAMAAAVDDEDAAVADRFLSDVAAREGLEVGKTEWFSISGGFVQGFMKTPESQFPGVERRVFDRTVRSLIDYRFAVVSSKLGVWLVELDERSLAHTPDFAEAKEAIKDKALADARMDAFKADVMKIAAGGAEAVLASGNVSTNITFSPCSFARDYAMGWFNMYGEWDFSKAGFPNAQDVVFAAHTLEKGGVSDFVPLYGGRGLLVVCNDRRDGDPADLMRGERFGRFAAMRNSPSFEGWLERNLKRLGYEEKPASAGSAGELE